MTKTDQNDNNKVVFLELKKKNINSCFANYLFFRTKLSFPVSPLNSRGLQFIVLRSKVR